MTIQRGLGMVLVAGLILAGWSGRADQYWDGGDSSWNLGVNNNWYGDNQPTWGYGGGGLHFAYQNTGTGVWDDYGIWVNTESISWDTTYPGSYGITGAGNGINFNTKIENNSSYAQTLGIPTSGSKNLAGYIEVNPINADLTITQPVYNDNNVQYRVYGNNGHVLTISGSGNLVGSSAASISINQNSTLKLSTGIGMAGDVYICAGTLQMAMSNPLASGFIRVGDTSGSVGANLNLDGGYSATNQINVRSGSSGSKVIANTSGTSGTATFSGALYLDADATVYANSGGTVALTGSALDLKNQLLTVDGAGASTISGTLQNSTGSGRLTKTGAGTLTMSAINTFTGGLTNNGGIVQFTTSAYSMGRGPVVVNSGATNWLNVGNTTYTNTFSGSGVLKVTTGNGDVTLNNNVGSLSGFTGTLDFNQSVGSASKTRFTTSQANLPSPSATLQVQSGTTLYLNQGYNYGSTIKLYGAGNTENLGALRLESGANQTNAVILLGNSFIGVNSSAATISGVISESGGSYNFTKQGNNTLTLSGANTYSGGTTNSAGTLTLGSTTALGTGALVMTGGNLDSNVADLTNANNNVQFWNNDFTFTGSQNLHLGTGAVTPSGTPRSVTVTAKNLTIGGAIGGTSELRKLGAGTLTLSGANTYTGGTRANLGTLVLSGSHTHSGSDYISVNNVGAQNAVLIISSSAGAQAYNDMPVAEVGSSRGAVYQQGGSFSTAGGNGLRVGAGATSYGYYNLSGGTLSINGTVDTAIGYGNGGAGVMDITGGSLAASSWIVLGRNGGTASGLLNVTGGSVSSAANNIGLNWTGSSGAISILNVGGGAGAASVTGVNNAGNYLDVSVANVAGQTGVVNVRPNGTLTVSKVQVSGAASTALFNFNGGTLKANAANAGANFMNSANMDAVTVYSGGGTIDNNGTSITIGNVLGAATGNGVTSITGPSTQGSGYIGAPLVTITGGTGNPATGYAVMIDDGTGNGTYKVSGIVITSPGTYTVDPTTVTLTGGGAGTAASGFTINTGANTSGGMTFQGGGTTTVSVANTYTGNTTVNAGTLSISSDGNLGAAPGSATPGSLTITNGTLAITTGFTLNANRGLAIGPASGSGSGTIDVASGQTLTYGGIVANNGAGVGGLTKNGSGTLTLTLSPGNTYTGGTTLNAGSIFITSDTQLGAVPGSPAVNLTFNGGTLYKGNAAVPLNANRTISLGASGGYLQPGYSQDFSVNGLITGLGGLGINWDTSTVTLNAVNNYQGNTTIGAAGPGYYANNSANVILKMGIDNALPYGAGVGNVVFGTSANNNTPKLDLNGHNVQINGLTGSANATIDNTTAGSCVLTVGNNDQSGTFAGVIKNTSGTLALTKTGAGAMTLSNTNTYTGVTIISNGTLAASCSWAISNSPTISIVAGATCDVSAVSGGYTLGAAQTLKGNGTVAGTLAALGTVSPGFSPGTLNVTGNYTNSGTLQIEIASASSYDRVLVGGSAVLGGTLTVSNLSSYALVPGNSYTVMTASAISGAFAATNIYPALLAGQALVISTNNNVLVLSVSGTPTANTYWWDPSQSASTLGGAGTWDGSIEWLVPATNGQLIAYPNVSANGDTAIFAGTSGTVGHSGTLYVNNLTFATNGYTLSGGTFDITGSASAGVVVSNGAAATVSSGITGANGLTKSGAGTLTLSGANSYSGNTTNSAGTLTLGSTTALGTGALVMNVGNLDSSVADLVNANNNAQFWNSDFTFVGSQNLNLGTGNVTPSANRQVTVSANTLTVGGAISGAYSLTKAGAGTLTLSGANTYSGLTTVSAGTLNLTGTSSMTGGLDVTGDGTLTLAGTFGTSAAVNVHHVGQATGKGTLNIPAGVSITRYNLFVGDNSAGDGAVYQSGGSLTLTQAGVDTLRVGSSASGKGYYKLSSGTLTVGELGIGASLADTIGVMDVTGGTLTDSGYITIARGTATSSGLLNVMGGTCTATRVELAWTGNASSLSVLNVGGGVGAAAVITSPNTSLGLDLLNNNTAGSLSIANLLASGTLMVGKVYASGAFSGGGANPTAVVNFNGGTLKAATTCATTAFMTDGNIDGVYIYPNGATIDDNGQNITISTPLLAPTAGGAIGVTGIAVSGGGGYIGAPLVKITGGTFTAPATAVANMVDDGGGTNRYKVGSFTITSPGVYTVAPTTVTLLGGGAVVASTPGAISTAANASGGLTKVGAGTTTLSGANTFTGPIALNAGTLALSGSGTLGAGANDLNVNSGTLDLGGLATAAAGAVTVTNGTIQHGTLTASTSYTVSNNGAVTLSAKLAGAVALTKSGAGVLTLSSNNTYSAGTTVNNGTLTVNGSVAGTVLVAAGATLNGTGTVSGVVTVNNTGSINLTNGVAETLTVGGLSLDSGSVIALDLGTPSTSDKIVVSGGSVTANGTTITIATNIAGFGPGTYTLIQGGVSSASGFTLNATAPHGQSYTLVNSGSDLQLVVAYTIPPTAYWTGATDGQWTTGANWATNKAGTLGLNLAPGDVSVAVLTATGAGNLGTVLGSDMTIDTLIFDNASAVGLGGANNLTINSGLTVSNSAAAVTVSNGTTVALGNSQTWTHNGANALTVNGVIQGTSKALTLSGGGTLTLTGANTFDGGLTVNGPSWVNVGANHVVGKGALTLANGGLKGTGAYTVSNAVTLVATGTVDTANGNLTLSGVIGGAGTLVKTNSNLLILTGANTYSNGMVIAGGVVQITTEAQLGAVPAAPAVTLTFNGGTLYNNGSSSIPTSSVNQVVSLGSGGGYFQPGWGPRGFVINGLITGVGALSVAWDSGILTLNAVNDYQGATTIGSSGGGYWNNGGATPTLRLGIDNAIPYGAGKGNVIFGTTLNNTATLDLYGHNAQINGLSGSGMNGVVDNTTGTGTYTLTVGDNNQSSAYSGVIRTTTGKIALTKIGTGTLTLTASNTYAGATTVSAGTLVVNGKSPTNTLTVAANAALAGTGTVYGAVTLQVGAAAISLTNGVGGTLTLTNGLALNDGNVMNFDVGAVANSDTVNVTGGTYSKNTSETVTINITKLSGYVAGTNDLIVASGLTSTNGFTLATASPTGFNWWLSADPSGKLQLVSTYNSAPAAFWSGASDTSWENLGNWASDLSGTPATLPPGPISTVTFTTTGAGHLDTILGNDLAIDRLVVNGQSATTIGGDKTLTLTSGIVVSNGASGMTISNAALALGASQAWTNNNTANPLTIGSVVSGEGMALTLAGAGTNVFTGTSTYNGGTTLSNGVLKLGHATDTLADTAPVTVAGGTLDMGANNDTVGTVTLASGTITGGSGVLSGSAYDARSGTVSGNLGGPAALTKTTSGTLTLSSANSYSGGTILSAGTINFANSTAFGSGTITANGGTIKNTAGVTTTYALVANSGSTTLDVSGGNWTFDGNISGSGTIVRGTAAGLSLYLGGDNNGFSGIFTNVTGNNAVVRINAATAGSANAIWYLENTSAGKQTLDFAAGTIYFGALRGGGQIQANAAGTKTIEVGALGLSDTFSGIIANSSATVGLTKVGSGTMTLSGASANTYTGTTTVNAGELDLNKTAGVNAIGGNLVIGDGSGSDSVKLIAANQIPDTADVTVSNTATLNLNGNSETIGTLNGSGTVDGMSGTPVLTVSGSGNSTFSGLVKNTAGSLTLAKSGSGTLTLSSANTYSGGTTISAGMLVLGNGDALGTGAVTANGGTLKLSYMSINTTITNAMVVNSLTTLDVASGNWYMNGNISGSGTIVRGTSATVTLFLGGDNHAFTGIYTNPANGNAVLRFTAATAGSSNAIWYLENTTVGRQTLTFGTGALSMGALRGGGEIRTDVAGAKTLVVGALGSNDTFSGIIANGSGTMGLTKVGTGTLTLTGANTYTGPTTVSNGTLAVHNTLGNSAVTNVAGTTLLVTNTTFGGSLTLLGSATLSMTNGAAGTLTVQNGLTLNGGNVLRFDLGAADGSHNDKIAVSGTYTAPSSGTVTINLAALSGLAENGTYDLITGATGISANSFTLGAIPEGYAGRLQVSGSTLQVSVCNQLGAVYNIR